MPYARYMIECYGDPMLLESYSPLPEPFIPTENDGHKRGAIRAREWFSLTENKVPKNIFYQQKPSHDARRRWAQLAHHITFLMFVANRLGRLTPEHLDMLLGDAGALHDTIHRAQLADSQKNHFLTDNVLLARVEELEDLVPELFPPKEKQP